MGYTVDGAYESKDDKGNTTTKYALNAGGFAGSLQAAILGDKDSAKGTGSEVDTAKDSAALTVTGLRAVESGQYAGGFFGLADVSSVASVGGGEAGKDQNTNLLLKLLKVGNVGVLEAFRTFIYDGQVNGVSDGIQIVAHDSTTKGMLDSKRYTGAAGGFGGGLINGSVKQSAVTNLNSVTGVNYVGGFIGHLANPARSPPTMHNSARMRSICLVPRPAYLTSGLARWRFARHRHPGRLYRHRHTPWRQLRQSHRQGHWTRGRGRIRRLRGPGPSKGLHV